MKIAMFTDTYLPARDGVVTSILVTKKQLESMGHTVYLFAPAPKDPKHREEGVYYFKAMSFSKYQGYTIPLFPTDKCHILKGLDVDVIHTHGLLFQGLRSMLAGKALKLPVVVTWHTMVNDAARYYNFTPFPEWLVDMLMWRYLKSLCTRAEAVVAPTNAIKVELLKYAPRMRQIAVVPTGIDCDRFRPENDGSAIRKKLGINDKKVILTLGRIAREKNLELILNGFKLLRQSRDDVVLVIAGQGPARSYYEQMVWDLGIGKDVIFTGFVGDDELPEYYAACNAFTLASMFETQGLVVLEAMATGKPVSGISFRAVAEIIKDGKNGFAFLDEQGWSDATNRALDASPELKREARTTAEGYDLKIAAEKLVDLYGVAIRSKKARLR
ncbi:MAG TPA: glycosyltransferase [Methanomassiliicoccales archaeon]|nr:glycosyltransferase [Methanomassiliicoccales archaeon]